MFLNRKSTLIVTIVLVVTGLIILDSFGVFSFLKGWLIIKSDDSIERISYIKEGINSFADFISSVQDLNKENEELHKQNKELTESLVKQKELEEENQELRNSLLIPYFTDVNKIMVDVSQNILQGDQEFFYINQGYKSGVKENQLVVDSSGYLLGKIKNVESNWAQGVFTTYLSENLSVSIAGKDIKAVISTNAQGWEIDLVPRGKELAKGDIVLLEGDENYLASGNQNIYIIIGRIKEITSKEQDIFIKGQVEPLIKYSEIDHAFVLID